MSLHRETFTALVQANGWTRGAELGVDKGILFGMLLRACPDLRLLGVDLFPDPERSKRVPSLVAQFSPRASVMALDTVSASAYVEDGSLDFVFIDADHREPAVRDDIAHWRPKVRSGGWLGGHDYSPKFPGVIQAVDRAFGTRIRTYPGAIWGITC